jgi:arylsulfatase A-like enzyme
VGHALGPDAPEVRDIAIRTDRLLGQLFARIEQITGVGNFLAVLTADHGVAPVPEVNQARHMPGGRISVSGVVKTIADALANRFGPGNWLLTNSASMPYFNLKLIEDRKLERAVVENVAADAAAAFPHIARVFTRTQLMNGGVPPDLVGRAVALGYYPPRSGDLVIVQEPYYVFEATGTSHGTPYEYDAHVPVIFLGPGIKPGRYTQPITVNDIAPTLAEILGLARPAGAAGRVLAEMLE